jgi:hypothetical protein
MAFRMVDAPLVFILLRALDPPQLGPQPREPGVPPAGLVGVAGGLLGSQQRGAVRPEQPLGEKLRRQDVHEGFFADGDGGVVG